MPECEFIEVTQSSDSMDKVLFVRTDDKTSTPTKNSTWKHPNEDVIIFYAGSATEWRLGRKRHQNTDNYYFKGAHTHSFLYLL